MGREGLYAYFSVLLTSDYGAVKHLHTAYCGVKLLHTFRDFRALNITQRATIKKKKTAVF